jgi:hypothetical protein
MKRFACILFICCLFAVSNSLTFGQASDGRQQKFDAFGDISADDASARLDNFAIQLEYQPSATGAIVSYGPQGEGSGTGKFLLRVIKDYLTNSRGVDETRIQTIYAGRYQKPAEIQVELWVISAGSPVPEPRRYNSKPKTVIGRFLETYDSDSSGDGCACGPSFGNTPLAAFADTLREQPKTVAYIVAFNLFKATPGAWRRVAKRLAADLREDGIEADRIKIVFAGTLKPKDDEYGEAKVQYWILPNDAPPPIKEAKPERTPKEAVQIGSYYQFELKSTRDERRIFQGFADVVRADPQLRLCFIVRDELPSGQEHIVPGELPDIDQAKLVERWRSELQEKLGIKENRIFILRPGAEELKGAQVEVWVVPLGASLPDPYASSEEAMP